MYFYVFWCEFIDLVGFFGNYCLTLVTYEVKAAQKNSRRSGTLSTRRRFAA